MRKEYRVHAEGSMQGHYIIAKSKAQALEYAKDYSVLRNEKLKINLWKTTPKGGYYPTKLSLFAQKKMGLLK